MLLEFRFHGGFYFFNATDNGFDFVAGGFVQQGNAGTCTCCIACTLNLRQIAVWNKPQNHGVFHVNVGTESSRQPDFVDMGDFEFVHQQLHACIECGLGHLDGANIILGHPNQGFIGLISRLTNDVVECALVGFDAGAEPCKCTVHQTVLADNA